MSENTLFLQLQVFDIEPAAGPRAMVSALSRRLREKRIDGVIYGDANDHRGIGLLTWANDPADILDNVHALLGGKRFAALTPRPGWAMFGRVTGDDTESTTETLLRADQRWGVWYPVRNKPEWGSLDEAARSAVHREHGAIAKSFIDEDKVAYVRLSCHGLDPEDNDHIFGLTAGSLADISLLQEAMRGTSQVSTYVDKMGPVFVGRKVWQNPEPARTEDEPSDEESTDATAAAGTDEESTPRTDAAAEAEPTEEPSGDEAPSDEG
jgi:chlorite dismutase